MTNIRMSAEFAALVESIERPRRDAIERRIETDRRAEKERRMAQGIVYVSTERKLSARELRMAEKRDRREIRKAMAELGI